MTPDQERQEVLGELLNEIMDAESLRRELALGLAHTFRELKCVRRIVSEEVGSLCTPDGLAAEQLSNGIDKALQGVWQTLDALGPKRKPKKKGDISDDESDRTGEAEEAQAEAGRGTPGDGADRPPPLRVVG